MPTTPTPATPPPGALALLLASALYRLLDAFADRDDQDELDQSAAEARRALDAYNTHTKSITADDFAAARRLAGLEA